jgi:NAD/NADP transhydrogenase alpha subunit
MSQQSNQNDPVGDIASLTVQGAVVGIAASAATTIPTTVTLATITTAGVATVITAPVAGLVAAGMAIAYGASIGQKIAKACDRLQNSGSNPASNAQQKPI